MGRGSVACGVLINDVGTLGMVKYLKLNQMKKLIISAERENIKTGEFTTQDMVKNVRKIIEKNAE